MGKTRSVMLETDDGRWELPVNPKEISVTQDSKDKTIDLLNVGEFNVPGNRGLIKISLSTFLPDSSSPFYKGVDPEQIISSVKKAKTGSVRSASSYRGRTSMPSLRYLPRLKHTRKVRRTFMCRGALWRTVT